MFEGFIINERTDIFNSLCSIDAHEKYHPSSCDDGSSGGGLSTTIKFNKTNDFFVEFDGSGQPPPLLPSSHDDG